MPKECKTAIVWRRDNFNVAKDISLEAEVAYVNGHPIVKTKTVVLNYRGEVFRASESKTAFTKRLIKDLLEPIYVVELINYLSRIINGENLFDIYVNNRNSESKSLVELTFVDQGNTKVGGAPHLAKSTNSKGPERDDESEYLEGLIDSEHHFRLNPLLATMNRGFTRTFASIEELDYVPVYGYISSSDSLSRMSEPILHLAIVFNVLAHQDRFSGINNQEAISSFNAIMDAKRLNERKLKDLAYYKAKAEKLLDTEIEREEIRDGPYR